MIRTAILLTVYNRRDVTLLGLRSLYECINQMDNDYVFDIYMTDDGSSDGTSEAVSREFPHIFIIKGNGHLYWGGGMRLAWNTAVNSKINYNFFLWYNDDSNLRKDALKILFNEVNGKCIISGAFCDKNFKPSYTGRDKKGVALIPNGEKQSITLMNGNLVLIPYEIFQNVGMIDERFVHAEGDYDYGLRARSKGYDVYLTPRYVGIAERHDEYIPKYCLSEYPIAKRWQLLHNPIYSPYNHFIFNVRYKGVISALSSFAICYIGVVCPRLYTFLKKKVKGRYL